MRQSKRDEHNEAWVDSQGAIIRRGKGRAPVEEPAGDKRQFERVDVYRKARVTELDSFGAPGAPFESMILNVSRGGLGLRTPRMVHEDRRVFVDVLVREGDEPRIYFGVVRQVRYVEGQGYFVGVQFEAVPRTGPIDAWLRKRKGEAGRN